MRIEFDENKGRDNIRKLWQWSLLKYTKWQKPTKEDSWEWKPLFCYAREEVKKRALGPSLIPVIIWKVKKDMPIGRVMFRDRNSRWSNPSICVKKNARYLNMKRMQTWYKTPTVRISFLRLWSLVLSYPPPTFQGRSLFPESMSQGSIESSKTQKPVLPKHRKGDSQSKEKHFGKICSL